MKRFSAVCCTLVALAATAPAPLDAQSTALSVGSASPTWGGRGSFSGLVMRGDLVWSDPNRVLNWRTSGSFTRLAGGMGLSGDQLPAAQIYALSASAILAAPGYLVPYLAAGPGLYGYRSFTEYRLGWHLAAGLQKTVGQWTLFGEATRTSLGTSASSSGLINGQLRSLSIGIRR